MRGSERWLLCRVGVGAFLHVCVYMFVCTCARGRLCASMRVCVIECGCLRCMIVWQENRSWDLKNTCLGPFENSALSWQHCLGLGGYFKGLLGIKDSCTCYTFSILRFHIAINFGRLETKIVFHIRQQAKQTADMLSHLQPPQEKWFIMWW